MTTIAVPEPPATRTHDRLFYWIGIACVVLGLAYYFFEFFLLKHLITPWYVPILSTVGLVLLFVWFLRKPGWRRAVSLVLILFVTGAEWAFIGWVSKSPPYDGPGVGEPFPNFAVSDADGVPFTNKDLAGRPAVLVFYRGHW